MTREALAPTREQLNRDTYEAPEINRDVNRPFYRKLDEFQRLFRSGTLEETQFAASRKLIYHWEGSLGRDVRLDEGGGPGAGLEFARTYHAQMIKDAELQVTPKQWKGLIILLEERGGVFEVGGAICQRKCPKGARAVGTELVSTALDLLALHWGHASR